MLRAATFGVCLFVLPLGCAADATREVPVGQVEQAITADSIMARAKEWVAQKVLYCTVANHKWDATCSYTCNRPTAAWDAYRSDCSGFVSWCWQLASQPASRTYMVDKAGADGWTSIPIDSLTTGDALVCNGHIMLFSRWVSSTSFEIYQESSCGKVANVGTRTFKRNPDGTLLIGSDTRIYHPIRRNGLVVPPADTGAPDTAKPDTAPVDASPSDAASDAAPDTTPVVDDAGVPDPDPIAPPDDGDIPGDDAPPPGEELTGSCGLGARGESAWLLGVLGVASLIRRRRAR